MALATNQRRGFRESLLSGDVATKFFRPPLPV